MNTLFWFSQTMWILLLSFVVLSQAWGPSTHYFFTCAALNADNVADCIQTRSNMMSGAEMPDAFYFGNFVDSASCLGFGELHNPVFATFLAQQAIALGNESLVDFAVGYGSHVVADVAGFFPGGFLGNGFFPNGSVVNWISMWPYMTATDAFVMQTITNVQPVPVSMNIETANFFSATAQNFAALDPTIPVPSSAQVLACATQWKSVVSIETSKAKRLPESSYQFEMGYNNPFNSSTFAQVQQDFNLASSCATGGIQLWNNLIHNSSSTLMSVISKVEEYFVNQFSVGNCSPVKGVNSAEHVAHSAMLKFSLQ